MVSMQRNSWIYGSAGLKLLFAVVRHVRTIFIFKEKNHGFYLINHLPKIQVKN